MRNFVMLILLSFVFVSLGLLPIIDKSIIQKFFIHSSYWIITLIFFWWFYSLIMFLKKNKTFLSKYKKKIIQTAIASLALCIFIFLSTDVDFKTNSDETNLLSVSKSLLHLKKPYNVTMGKHYFENFNPIIKQIPKRPLMFPYIVQIIHSFFGFSKNSPFALNFVILFSILFIFGLFWTIRWNLIMGICSMFLIIAHPIVPIFATSAGFDLFAAFFLILSLVTLFLYLNGHGSFGLLISTLTMFSHSRYESFGIAFIILVFALLKTRKENLNRKLYIVSPFIFSMLLHWWQRSLKAGYGFQDIPEGKLAFSFENLQVNITNFFQTIFDFGQMSPHANLLTIVGMISIIYLFILAIRKKISYLGELLIISISVLVHVSIFWFYFFGKFSEPSQARFYLTFVILCSQAIMLLFVLKKDVFNNKLIFIFYCFSFLSFIYYYPIAIEGRFINNLILNRELKKIYSFIKTYDTKNILLVYERPGQLSALNYGAINHQYAKKNWSGIIDEYRRGLFQKLVIIQRKKYPGHPFKKLDPMSMLKEFRKKNEYTYLANTTLKEILKFQSTSDEYMTISEVVIEKDGEV